MQLKGLLLLAVLFFSVSQNATAQDVPFESSDGQNIPPKREMRGAWVTTVANIDFPKGLGYSPARFEEEWTNLLDEMEALNLNAVFAQVRPAGDALYASRIAPWSKYLSGKQGEPLEEGYDPLEKMIAEAHARNMEFHAWLNPYRASMDTLVENLHKNHPYHEHPDWFHKYGGKLYFNPAKPEVRDYITEVVLELMMEYDIDGIHFDDYFYPYPAAGEAYPDAADFATYGYGYTNIGKWRRNNVNRLISQVSAMKKAVAPHVKFGISPFGVWRNASTDPTFGSPSKAGIQSFDDLYADVRHWLEKDWIDYVAPQLYWHIGFPAADFEQLLNWWQENSFGRQVYAGVAMYKVGGESDPAWKDPKQIERQILLTRAYPNVFGSLFFNTTSLLSNRLRVKDNMATDYFRLPAVWPEMAYLKLPPAETPFLAAPKMKKGKLQLQCSLKPGDKNAHYLIVYRFEDRRPGDYNNPQNILKILPLNGEQKVTIEDESTQTGKTYTYAISAVNRQHTESLLSEWKAVEMGKKRLKKVK